MGTAGHEAPFRLSCGTVEHAGCDADDILGGSSDFNAEKILAVIKANQGLVKVSTKKWVSLSSAEAMTMQLGIPLIKS